MPPEAAGLRNWQEQKEKNTPGEIRTPDFLIRSQALYPAELRVLSLSSGLESP